MFRGGGRYGQRRRIGAVHPFVLRVTINILWEDDVGTVHHVRQGSIDAFALQVGFASGSGLSEVTVGGREKSSSPSWMMFMSSADQQEC